ncbi:MAG: pseudouridine synthase [Tissierellia bacterium]|nr:pseudouridine synthase [Tissierellia bacterium]
MRLQKYIAHAGIASRRKAEKMIEAGQVKVNGQVVLEQGVQVKPGDLVEVRGKKISLEEEKTTLVLNKPRGVISTAEDEKGRPTVLDYAKGYEDLRLYPVGRLDRDTTGLILLTDDGDLTYRLTHPSFEVEKTYHATVGGIVSREEIKKLREGILLEDGMTAPGKFKIMEVRNDKTRVACTIHEGKNRQIRRMFEALGHPVLYLKRISYGPIKLGSLPSGQLRGLSAAEKKWLRALR